MTTLHCEYFIWEVCVCVILEDCVSITWDIDRYVGVCIHLRACMVVCVGGLGDCKMRWFSRNIS